MSTNIHYPPTARKNKIEGKVYVQFVVEPNGSVTNVKAMRGPSPLLNAEAVRVIKRSPKWAPGLVDGKKVRTAYTVPVNFTLDAKEVILTPPPAPAHKVTQVVVAAPPLSAEKIAKAVNDPTKIFEAVEVEPSFPGGLEAFNRFLANTIKYPAIDRENNVMGKAYVTFVVERDGSLSDVRAVRGPSETIKAEAVRGVSLSPKWKPGIQNGRTVRVNYTVPVNFNFSGNVAALPPPINRVSGPDANGVYNAVEKEPSFPGGIEGFNRFLSNTVKYPAVDREKNITGKVYISFIVEKDGSLSDVRAIRGPSETTKAEAARAVALSPRWSPGTQNGVPVRVSYTVPVNFTLRDVNGPPGRIYAADSAEFKNDGSMVFKGHVKFSAAKGENKPLIILDGKEYTKDLNLINPNDIVAITVLKEATATKKYGDKAKNGVIEITTKVK